MQQNQKVVRTKKIEELKIEELLGVCKNCPSRIGKPEVRDTANPLNIQYRVRICCRLVQDGTVFINPVRTPGITHENCRRYKHAHAKPEKDKRRDLQRAA